MFLALHHYLRKIELCKLGGILESHHVSWVLEVGKYRLFADYSKTKKGVDMMEISKKWYHAGREVKNRLDRESIR